jgi:hypothetical protein
LRQVQSFAMTAQVLGKLLSHGLLWLHAAHSRVWQTEGLQTSARRTNPRLTAVL